MGINFFLLLLFIQTIQAKDRYCFNKADFETAINPKFGAIFLNATSLDPFNVLIDIEIRDTLENVIANIEACLDSKFGRQVVLNQTFDICKILNVYRKSPSFIALIIGPFLKSSVIPKKCPIEKGHYYDQAMQFSGEQFPFIVKRATVSSKISLKGKLNGKYYYLGYVSSRVDLTIKQSSKKCKID